MSAIHHKSRYARHTPWTRGRIVVLCGASVVIAAALFLMLGTNSTTEEESKAAVANAAKAAAVVGGSTCSGGRSFYASPDGQPGNSGGIDAPLDLHTALSEKSPAAPCDTIWLREGTYKGAFKSALKGSDYKPIIVRQYPGERATLDSAGMPGSTLQVDGAWAWYWGFEVTNSDPQRVSKEPGAWPSDLRRGTGVGSRGTNLKFINLVVHDNARGFEVNSESISTEVYGNLIYYNGWEAPGGGGQGNGIDTQNVMGSRRIADNVIFNQFSHGIIASGKPLDNLTLDGNTIFSNGSLSHKGVAESRNVLLGGGVVSNRPVITNNSIYDGQTNIGYDTGCADGTIAGNYFAGPLILVKCTATMKDNVVYDPSVGPYGYGPLPTEYPNNTYNTSRPPGVVVRVRANQYEPGRGTVTVFNWDKKSEVAVNLADAGLAPGDRYEIRDVQNYFEKPAVVGTYKGGTVNLPMSSVPVSTPAGTVPAVPKHTLPDFGVFVIVKLDGKSGT